MIRVALSVLAVLLGIVIAGGAVHTHKHGGLNTSGSPATAPGGGPSPACPYQPCPTP